MQIVGHVPYNAVVVPKGGRKPRRTVLFAPVVYDVPEIAASDLVADALVMTDANGRKTTFAGWNGRLWRKGAQPSPERLAAVLANPYAPGIDPRINLDYDQRRCPDSSLLYVADLAHRTTDDFPGRILSGDRGIACERAEAVVRGFAVVDGEVWTKAPDPLWRVSYNGNHWRLEATLFADPHQGEGIHLFRADRLDDAKAWHAENTEATLHERGAYERALPEFISRNDLSHFVAARAETVLSKLQNFVRALPEDRLLAWHRACRILEDARPSLWREDSPFPDPAKAEAIVAAVRACRDHLAAVHLDEGLVEFDWQRSDVFDPFLARADFEAERRPAATLAAEDDAALSAAAP